MKNLFLIRLLTVLILFFICTLGGCDMDIMKYNVTVVETGVEFNEDFLTANTLYDPYNKDETLPKFRTHIIKEQSKFDEVFIAFPQIDFQKEMILIYVYTCYYNGRSHKIQSVDLDGKTLKIGVRLKREYPYGPDMSSPMHRFLVIKMDSLDIKTVKFEVFE